MDWDNLVRTVDGIKEMSYREFVLELEKRLDGREYKSKVWSNYPNSTFFYLNNDDVMQDEIAIYTSPTAWAIYVSGDIRQYKRA